MSVVAFQLEAIQLERSSSNDSSLKEKPPILLFMSKSNRHNVPQGGYQTREREFDAQEANLSN